MNRHLVLLLALGFAPSLGAQTTPGYSTQSAATERATEADAIARASATSASAHSKFLSLQPHMAGTPAQARTRDYVIDFHATNARIGVATLLRIANAEILPYDYVEYARTMRRLSSQVERSVTDKHWKLSAGVLSAAAGRMESAAVAFNAARDRALTAQLSPRIAKQVNATLLGVERQLTRPQGLVTRPWFRNLVYAADENNGYSTMVFPSVNEAIRLGDEAAVEREIADLVKRFDSATQVLQVATGLLQRS